MAPPLKGLSLLLLFATSVLGVQYEVRGNIDIINSFDINPEYYNEEYFTEKLEKASERMAQIIGPDFKDFLIHDFKIHGESTAVFHARLTLTSSPSISREDIIDRIVATDDVQIYFLRENKAETPERSVSRFRIVRADVDHCLHGGILLPNATCSCLPYYSGANCEVVSCRNNGIGEKGRCVCPPGLYSAHCEARQCVAPVDSVVDFSSQSMILVINTRTSMAFDLNTIIEKIPTLVKDYVSQGVTVASYIVTIYRYSKTVYFMETNSFTTSDQMIDYLHSVALGPSTDDQPHLDAIVNAQSTSVSLRPKSTVFVFADSENLNDPTPSTLLSSTNESLAIQQTLSWRNKIEIILTQWTASPLSPSGNYFDVLRRLVTAVHGDIYILDKTELNNFIENVLFSVIGGQNSFVQYYNNQSKAIPILSDAATQQNYVMMTVESGTLPNIQDQNGNTLKPTQTGNRFALYTVQQSVSSSIKVVGDTIPAHNIRVWFPATDDVLVSYSEDDTVDNNYAHTFNGFNQRPSLYSSFATTTGLTVSRLNSFTSEVVQPAAAATAKTAVGCIFPYQLAALTACTPGPFVHNVVVSTSAGNKYRAVPGYCFTPDTHSAPAWSCLNNGTRSGTKSCNCASSINFSGQHCEVPVCQNGGTVDKFPNGGGHGNCVCPFGVSGSFCEIMTCSSTSPDVFQSYNRSFAIVVQNSLSANQALIKLNDGLRVMLGGSSNDFEDFVLTTYKSRQIGGAPVPDISSTKFSSSSAFLNATTDDGIQYSYSPSGSQPGLFALEATLRSMDYDKSSIFLFTDSVSSVVENSLNFTDIVQTAVERQIEISIVIIAPYGASEMCMDVNGFQEYENLARATGGNFINLCLPYTPQGDPVFNFIASYGSSHHHTEVVAYYEAFGVSSYTTRDFFLTGNDAYAVVYSPTVVNFTAFVVDSQTGTQQTLIPDSHSVPFFASYQIKMAAGSSMRYKLTVNPSNNGDLFIRITERSQFSAYLGFSPDPSTDRYSKDITYGTYQQPVLHLSSTLQSEPTIDITSYDKSNNVAFTSTFSKRTSGCKYEYIMKDQFTCQTSGDTFTVETTIITNEVTIMRTQRAFCSDLVGCINGGIMLAGQCQCINGYIGANCEIPTCQNGGTNNQFKCHCDAAHDGDVCQYIKCNDWNFVETHDPREYNFQQVVFVVEINTKNMVVANSYLQKNIQAFVDSTDDDAVPKQYTLITFDDQNIRTVVSSAHKDVFLAGFQKGITVAVNTPDTVRGLEAINAAYGAFVDLPGIIYVFTATKSATNIAAVRQRYGVQVNLIWMSTDVTQLDPSTLNYYYTAIARQSNGRLMPISPLYTPQMLASLAATVNENQLVLDDAAKDCTAGVNFKFPVGSLATTLTLVATGPGVSVTVTDENSKNVDLTYSQTFTDSNTLIRTIQTTNHSGGDWTVNVKGTKSCYLQARVNSPLQVIPRFTNDQGQDFGSGTPRVGAGATASSFITFRIMDSYNSDSNNFGSIITKIESADTDPETPWTTTSNFLNTTILARDPVECASQFVSPMISWTSTYMKFIVRGKDSNNNNFQRTFFFNKNANKSDCQNGATVDTYGFCQCDANHYGNMCQLRRCQNGGVSAYGLCDCPNGYYGDYCDQYISA